MGTQELQRFFNTTANLISTTKQIKKLKGENFNLFQILKVETAENNTHSNFIAELLNPNGSHELGAKPLSYFLNIIKFPFQEDLERVQVYTEYHIGKINQTKALGGRIDILLKFTNGETLSIENKINAGDQYQQLQRYCNYNYPNNRVYYLNLYGDNPNPNSIGDLECDQDYFIISYRNQILTWLDLCIKEASNQPILRESIKQYIILIKKLTNTLENTEHEKFKGLIFDFLEEAEYISSNFSRVIYETKEAFRNKLLVRLQDKLDNDVYELSLGHDVDRKFSQLWIDVKGVKKPQLRFAVEPFSGVGHHDGNMFVGLFDREGDKSDFKLEEADYFTDVWIIAEYLEDLNGHRINITNHSFLKKIHDLKSAESNRIMESLENQIINFLAKYEDRVQTYLQLKTLNQN